MSAPTEQHAPDPDVDPETGELPWDGFRGGRIQNFLGLDWAGEKLKAMERAIAENLAAFDAEHARRVARLRALQAPLAKERLFWLGAIETYAREVGRKNICIGKAKSRELPSGLKLSWRGHDAGYRYDQRPGPDCGKPPTPAQNRERLLAWAKAEEERRSDWKDWPPLAVPGPLAPDLDAIKIYAVAAVAECSPGTEIPGLEYVPAGEVLTVSVGEEEGK